MRIKRILHPCQARGARQRDRHGPVGGQGARSRLLKKSSATATRLLYQSKFCGSLGFSHKPRSSGERASTARPSNSSGSTQRLSRRQGSLVVAASRRRSRWQRRSARTGPCHHRAREFRKFLDDIEARRRRRPHVHLVMDNCATHKTPLIRGWLAKRPRWHVHLTQPAHHGSTRSSASSPSSPNARSGGNLPQRRGAAGRHHVLHRSAQRRPQTFPLDQGRRRHPRFNRALLRLQSARKRQMLRTSGPRH